LSNSFGVGVKHNVVSSTDANRQFPVVNEVGVPVGGMFVLMILFTIAIGPVNIWLLGRKDRRMWMLWTVPSISLVTCFAVFGYMVISEGWQGHLRSEGITLLDEVTHRATTFGWTAFYAPLTPGDGLHFSPDTELIWQKASGPWYGGGGGNRASCTMGWTQDQHLASGWVSARVPSHFKLRKSETRRERLGVTRGKEGALLALNGLGADVHKLWLADEKGQVYAADEIPAGSQVALTLQKEVPSVKAARASYSGLVSTNAWLTGGSITPMPGGGVPGRPGVTMKAVPAPAVKTPMPARGGLGPMTATPPPPTTYLNPAKDPVPFLGPLTYVAVLDGAPFIEDGLRNAKDRKCHSIVIGTLKEPDDAN
jgi:hypothetical protein